jgi:hypothetical protein
MTRTIIFVVVALAVGYFFAKAKFSGGASVSV